MSLDENLWLKGLSDRLKLSEFNLLAEHTARQDKDANITAYLNAISEANAKTIQEVAEMRKERVTLEQVLREIGWLDKWKAEGLAEGKAEERQKWQSVIADKDAEIKRLRTQLKAYI